MEPKNLCSIVGHCLLHQQFCIPTIIRSIISGLIRPIDDTPHFFTFLGYSGILSQTKTIKVFG